MKNYQIKAYLDVLLYFNSILNTVGPSTIKLILQKAEGQSLRIFTSRISIYLMENLSEFMHTFQTH